MIYAVFLLLWSSSVPAASLDLASEPTVSIETTVTVVDAMGTPTPGATVRATYRPGLDGEREVAIGITDGLGRVRWTPDEGGVATLRAGQHRQRVVIARQHVPATSLTLLLLLFVASAVAAAYGLIPRRRWRPPIEAR